MESIQDLLDVVLEWSFVPLALAIVLTATVGSGLWKSRWRRVTWLAGLGLLALAFYLGVRRHEWGEVLFNGQLL